MIHVETSTNVGRWTEIGLGAFTNANSRTFSGTAEVPEDADWVKLRVRPDENEFWESTQVIGGTRTRTTTFEVTKKELGDSEGDGGNPTAECSSVGLRPLGKVYGFPGSAGGFTVSGTPGDIDWPSQVPVDTVYVKAGTGGNWYFYDGAFTGAGLASPKDSVSHVTFCGDRDPEPTPTEPPVCTIGDLDWLDRDGDEV